jgi:VAD1 Analog of StAR-related lipid transfer domain
MDVPFGDYFSVETKWSLSEEADGSGLHLQGFAAVHFVKSTIFKSKIASESIKETKKSFETWLELVRLELAEAAEDAGSTSRRASSVSPSRPVSTPTIVATRPPRKRTRILTAAKRATAADGSPSFFPSLADSARNIATPTVIAAVAMAVMIVLGRLSPESVMLALAVGFVALLERHVAALQQEIQLLRSSHTVSATHLESLQRQVAKLQKRRPSKSSRGGADTAEDKSSSSSKTAEDKSSPSKTAEDRSVSSKTDAT